MGPLYHCDLHFNFLGEHGSSTVRGLHGVDTDVSDTWKICAILYHEAVVIISQVFQQTDCLDRITPNSGIKTICIINNNLFYSFSISTRASVRVL